MDLNNVDFTHGINVRKLDAVTKTLNAVKRGITDPETLKQHAERPVFVGDSKDKLYIGFGGSVTGVSTDFPEWDPLYASIGRARLDMDNMFIEINKKTGIVTIKGDIVPARKDNKDNYKPDPSHMDTFNFEPDPNRGWFKDAVTQYYGKYAPTGSTVFELFAKPGSKGKYWKKFDINEF